MKPANICKEHVENMEHEKFKAKPIRQLSSKEFLRTTKFSEASALKCPLCWCNKAAQSILREFFER
jgi:hypothetical protein